MGFLHWQGEMEGSSGKQRVFVALLLVLIEVTILFTGFSFLAFTPTMYVCLLLPPLAIAALLLGPLGGTLVGLATGMAQYLHLTLMPLHFYELLLITPLTSVALMALCGLLWGLLFHPMLQRDRTLRSRLVPLVLACLLVASVYAFGFASPGLFARVDTPITGLSGATLGDLVGSSVTRAQMPSLIAAQALVNALFVMLVCLLVHSLVRRVAALTDDVTTRMAFRFFFLSVFLSTFLLTITMSYVGISREELHDAEDAMRSDMEYLHTQLEHNEQGIVTIEEALGDARQGGGLQPEELKRLAHAIASANNDLLTGYTMENEGTVLVIANDVGTISLSDDPRLPVATDAASDAPASTACELLGPDIKTAIESSLASGRITRILYHGTLSAEGATDSYSHAPQIGYLLARTTRDCTIVIIEPESMVFRDRWMLIGRQVAASAILLGVALGTLALLVDGIIVRRIDKTNEALARITAGDLDARAEVEGTRELKSLSAGINTTVDALNRWITEAETRMDSELAAARAIQKASLPTELPSFPEQERFDIYASMRTAREVGGDFYDYFLVDRPDPDGGTERWLVLIVADVSGKGVPASLFMMKAKAMLRDAIIRSLKEYDRDTLEPVNRALCEGNDEFMFVTNWCAVINCATGHMRYVNAGHNQPLLGRDGRWIFLGGMSGIPLGMRKDAEYRMFTRELQPGDQLLVYTDGVIEARGEERAFFGEKRLLEAVESSEATSPRELVDDVLTAVDTFAGSEPQSDDITVLALTYRG